MKDNGKRNSNINLRIQIEHLGRFETGFYQKEQFRKCYDGNKPQDSDMNTDPDHLKVFRVCYSLELGRFQ